MLTQELFEVAERQVLEDEPVKSGGGVVVLLGPAVDRRVHAAQQINYVRIVQTRHCVARDSQKLRPKIPHNIKGYSRINPLRDIHFSYRAWHHLLHGITAITCHPTQVNAPRLNPSQ